MGRCRAISLLVGERSKTKTGNKREREREEIRRSDATHKTLELLLIKLTLRVESSLCFIRCGVALHGIYCGVLDIEMMRGMVSSKSSHVALHHHIITKWLVQNLLRSDVPSI